VTTRSNALLFNESICPDFQKLESEVPPPRKVRKTITRRPRTITSENLVASQLGEAAFRRGHRIGWARRMLLRGCFVARKGWALESIPRRLDVHLQTDAEIAWLVERRESTEQLSFGKLTWVDMNANDWYLVEQLELAR
jgi:hypothetical protein